MWSATPLFARGRSCFAEANVREFRETSPPQVRTAVSSLDRVIVQFWQAAQAMGTCAGKEGRQGIHVTWAADVLLDYLRSRVCGKKSIPRLISISNDLFLLEIRLSVVRGGG